ncbi:MAG: pseudouridine-5'-phosphate glycosidase, partial [Christensenellaceae bacterium]|nr:pseudouridine-5'-phosphate glycosidase [Christensenellaceae bacterium]
MNWKDHFVISEEVKAALDENRPVVALETSIISHGMPYPTNVETALMAERVVRENGAVPATIGVYRGKITVGMTEDMIASFTNRPGHPETTTMKASVKGIPYAVINGLNAGFTIAAELRVASMAGIRIMATGGLGGVSRGGEITMDVSADLEELGKTSVAVVCAGCKPILDIGRTKEVLETKD